uniref:SET domain-containing protein n=1 Tax=Aplanochytrium stocchinoi TaxID=215587 RepID=A0A7S3PEP5_9STRA
MNNEMQAKKAVDAVLGEIPKTATPRTPLSSVLYAVAALGIAFIALKAVLIDPWYVDFDFDYTSEIFANQLDHDEYIKTSEARFESFKKWVEAKNFTDSIDLVVLNKEKKYRGAVASRDISHGDTVLLIPREYIISAGAVTTGTALDGIPATANKLLRKVAHILMKDSRYSHDILALSVLWHRLVGQENTTKFSTYVRSMPDSVTGLPRYFNDYERSLLEGTVALRRADERDEGILHHYNSMMKDKYVAKSLAPFTKDEYFWARDMVDTRCFGLKVKGKVYTSMVPFADMPNHALECSLRWRFSVNDNAFVATAPCNQRKGSPVTLHYGSKENTALLANYGFVLDSNENDCVEVVILLEGAIADEDAEEIVVDDDQIAVSCYLYANPRSQMSKRCLTELQNYFSHSLDDKLEVYKLIWSSIHTQAKAWVEFFQDPRVIEELNRRLASKENSVNIYFAVTARRSEERVWKVWLELAQKQMKTLLTCKAFVWWEYPSQCIPGNSTE